MKKVQDVDHSGHRQRLISLVQNAGIENVSSIQAVETFLTFIIPRCDVNPLAHRLLDKFGDFHSIIDADVSDLAKVKGLNEKSASKIKLFASFMDYYASSKMADKINLKNSNEFLDFLEELLRFKSTENLYLFAISSNLTMKNMRKLDLKQVRAVGISPEYLFSFLSSTHPSFLVVAHNHPGGSARPSPDDGEAVKYISSLLEMVECQLFDSFVIGEDGIFSETQNGFVRRFESVNNVVNFLVNLNDEN